MAVEAAERLYEAHRPALLGPSIRAAALACRNEEPVWQALSTGEQAFVRLALSLWGAPGVTVALYRDLGALDYEHRRAVVEAIATACRVTL